MGRYILAVTFIMSSTALYIAHFISEAIFRVGNTIASKVDHLKMASLIMIILAGVFIILAERQNKKEKS